MMQEASPPIESDRSRWQFSLRTALLLTAVAAVLSALYRVGPQLDVLTLGCAPAILCAYHVVLSRWRERPLSRRAIAAILPSLGMLYVVSIGPAALFCSCFPWWRTALERFYAPLDWHCQHPAIRDPLLWYLEFWDGLTL